MRNAAAMDFFYFRKLQKRSRRPVRHVPGIEEKPNYHTLGDAEQFETPAFLYSGEITCEKKRSFTRCPDAYKGGQQHIEISLTLVQDRSCSTWRLTRTN